MAIKFIRSNKYEGVTAYQDAVLFHNSKGANGILKNVANQLAATYSSGTEKLTIDTGQAIAYGRQFELDEALEMDFGALGPASYITIYAEIDLSDPTAETVTFKSVYQDLTYPIVNAGDNLISIKEGVHKLALYHLHKEVASGTVTLVANIIEADKIAKAALADVATVAEDSELINGVKISHNASTKNIEVKATAASANEIIERKKLIYSNDLTEGLKLTKNTIITPTETIEHHSVLEVHTGTSSGDYKRRQITRIFIQGVNVGDNIGTARLSVLTESTVIEDFGLDFRTAVFSVTKNPDEIKISQAWTIKNMFNTAIQSQESNIYLFKIYKVIGGF